MTHLRLGSHYQLEERIGEGSIGVVWRGTDTETGAAYAVKLLRPEHAKDPATVARFVRERTALLRFRHPNVVMLHDMIVEGDQLALVMDLVADGDLAERRKRNGGTLAAADAAGIMAQACSALAAAHEAGIVHRDLKPANILLDGGEVRLTDFGIALVAGETAITTEGVFLGTLPYLAPEVIRGEEPTPACDCYAVGITLYELLAGRPPFTGVAAATMHGHLHLTPERPDGITDAAWQVIAACLDKDPGRRPAAAELEWALHDEARPPTARGSARRSAGWPGLIPAWDRDTVTRETSLGSAGGAAAVPAGAGLAVAAAPTGAGPLAEATLPAEALAPMTGAPMTGTPAAEAGLAGLTRPGPGGGAADAEGPLLPGGEGGAPQRPRRRPRPGWTAVALTAAAGIIAVIAFTLARSPGPSGSVQGAAAGNGAATTAGQPAGHVPSAAVSAGTTQRGGAAAPEASPGTQSGQAPGQTPGQTGTAKPTPSRTATAPSATSPTATSPSASAPPSGSASATPSPSASPTATPSPTRPADTAWVCGPAASATLATGKDTGQTLRACIRVHNGKLALHGILGATVKAWHEQIILLLEDAAGNVSGTYYSPVCTTAACNFTMTTTPADGQWTVLPEWARYGGNLMSAGQATGYVQF